MAKHNGALQHEVSDATSLPAKLVSKRECQEIVVLSLTSVPATLSFE